MQNNYSNQAQFGGFFVRAGAHFIDIVIVAVITLLIRFPLWIVSYGVPENIWNAGILFSYTIKDILLYVCGVMYYILLTYFTGATVGKRLMNLKVISADGEKLSLLNVVYRETIGRFLCTFAMGIGYMMAGVDKEKRGLHDILCDTRVVYEKKIAVESGKRKIIRRAIKKDIPEVVKIYDAILDQEEAGTICVGWARGVYPTAQTAMDALAKGTLFVYENEGKIVAAAKIDQTQVPEYADCDWEYQCPDNEVMVLHTLVVAPDQSHKGYGEAFVRFYEQYARRKHCHYLRMDTNEKNVVARKMYNKLGYAEAGIVSCEFNGIPGVQLVCLEKKLDGK